MNPSFGYSHHMVAVVEHEAIPVGVAEEVEGEDRTSGAAVNCRNRLRSAAHPDKLAVTFVGLLPNPREVGFSVCARPGDISGTIDDPDEFCLFAMCEPDFGHPEGGSAYEVGPPAVVLLVLNAEVLPLPEGRSSAENDVLPGRCGESGSGEENREKEKESHAPKMWQEGRVGKEGVRAVLHNGVEREAWPVFREDPGQASCCWLTGPESGFSVPGV